MAEGIKPVKVDFPKDWIPEIDEQRFNDGRSRHNMILRLVREALDARQKAEK